MKYLPYIILGLVLFLAAGFYIDRASKNSGRELIQMPSRQSNKPQELVELKNFGPAPELTGINHWLNSDPLTLKDLRGKVVLVDFWTYSCINCIRTLPTITAWYEKYKADGFVILGVHTPEFEFEKVTGNVETAIKRYKINYPVAQDNNFATWNAYQNRYWPAHYLIDKEGNIRYTHFGEGEYEVTENAIRSLLGMDPGSGTGFKPSATGDVGTPEMYFGTSRLEYLTSAQRPSVNAMSYSFPQNIEKNRFALMGDWRFEAEKAVLENGGGKIALKFKAGKAHMVAASAKPITVKITVDGIKQPDVTIQMSQLYTLFDSKDYREHEIIIEIPEAGFEAFTFTFG